MTARNRGWSRSVRKGTATWTFQGPLQIGGDYPVVVEFSVCDDTDGAGGDNGPFHVSYYQVTGGVINGRSADTTEWVNYLSDLCSNPQNFSHVNPADAPDGFNAATMGAARTNPSRPSVDIPVNLLELGDIPLLIKNAGQSLPARLGTWDLKYQFGIKPLVGDLVKLLILKKVIDGRIKEIKRLHSQKGLRRTVQVYSGSTTDQGDWLYQTNFGYFPGRWKRTTTQIVRVHCRWLPAVEFLPWDHTDDTYDQLAYKAVLGLSATQWSTYWEALPWSWLIDWCSTVGAFFQASRNIIPASLMTQPAVMRHTRSEWSGSTSQGSGTAACSGCRIVLEEKDRSFFPVFPSANLVFLNKDQMGIVASLAVRGL